MERSITLIPKDIVLPRATILGEESRGLYQKAIGGARGQFRDGTRAFSTIVTGINVESVIGSQLFWAINMTQYLPAGKRVMTIKDMERISDVDPDFFDGIYSDVTEVVLRTATPAQESNRQLLEHLVGQVKDHGYHFDSENPLMISGLRMVTDRNQKNMYGLLLNFDDNTTAENDQRFAYSNNEKRVLFGQTIKVLRAKENGMSRICVDKNNLWSMFDRLTHSLAPGRVVVVDIGDVDFGKLEEYVTGMREQS